MVVIGAVAWFWAGRHRWFFRDEWDFLAARDGGDLRSLLRPHNEHWSTLPILSYRLLWRAAGLHSYVPYQAVSITLHLVVAVLLRAVMRRAGVRPWIATAAASLFVLFGAGFENIIWAFQSAWVAAIGFGLVHLLCADHERPGGRVDRRDAAGLAAGVASLLCSGVGVTTVFVVALAMVLRRQWRAAAFHSVPLGAVYVVWSTTYGPDNYVERRAGVGDLLAFVRIGAWEAMLGLGRSAVVGAGVVVLVLAGFLTVLLNRGARLRAAPAIALSVGAIVFISIAAIGRVGVFGSEFARNSRYSYVIVALLLPAIALAADAIVQRRRAAVPVLAALLTIGLVGNAREMFAIRDDEAEDFARSRAVILTIPELPLTKTVPPRQRVDRSESLELTVGWLVANARERRIPAPGDVTPVAEAAATLRLVLVQSAPRGNFYRTSRTCAPHGGGPIELSDGDVMVVERRALITWTTEDGVQSWPRLFVPNAGRALFAFAVPLALDVDPLERGRQQVPVTICRSQAPRAGQ